jgi:hypothetical protein
MVEKAKKQGSFVSPPVATISESSGIPKRKYFPQRLESELRPLFTGQVFIAYLLRPRGCPGETHLALRGLGWFEALSRCARNDKGRRVANAPSFKPDR